MGQAPQLGKGDEMRMNKLAMLRAAMLAAAGLIEPQQNTARKLSFSKSHGNNPRSLNGNSDRNSKAAAQKRAARKRRNIRGRASKRA